MADSFVNAQLYLQRLRMLTSFQGDGPPPMCLPLHGARAMARLVLEHPVVLGDRRPDHGLRLFGAARRGRRRTLHDRPRERRASDRFDNPPGLGGDPLDDPFNGLRDDALGFVVGGTVALGMVGAWNEDLAERLLTAGVDVDPDSLRLKAELLDKPFGPPDVGPDWLDDLDRIIQADCWAGVIGAVAELGKFSTGSSSSDAAGIVRLFSPDAPSGRICPGHELHVVGSGFGSALPADTAVYVPTGDGSCSEAVVRSWTDTEIVVDAPAGIRPGCVGFVRGAGGGFVAPNNVAGELTSCVGAVGEIWGRGFDKVVGPVVTCPPCLPGGQNRIDLAGPPAIHQFTVTPRSVEPGGQAVLAWNVEFADSITLTRATPTGPAPVLPSLMPPVGSVTLGPYTGTASEGAIYRLRATNDCGSPFIFVALKLQRLPRLHVTNLEVVQSIQKPDNSVRLTANRRTAVRVFVDSGISDGFDSGSGPGMVSGLQATLFAQNLDTGSVTDCGSPWDSSFLAGPTVDRESLTGSAVFDVPLSACSGRVRFRAVVQAPGERPGDPPISWAEGSVDVSFTPKAKQELLPLIVTDPLTAGPPATLTDLTDNLAGPAELQPFPDNAFTLNPELSVTLAPLESLTTWSGWERFILRWASTTFVFHSQPVGGIRAGVVMASPAYNGRTGMAWPRIGAFSPVFIAVAPDPDTCAHELAHTYALDHIPDTCGAPWPYGPLPLVTSDPGLNVTQRTLFGSMSAELMGYCLPPWPSVEHWEAIFAKIPIS